MIIRVNVVLSLTLKMTNAQVVESSATIKGSINAGCLAV